MTLNDQGYVATFVDGSNTYEYTYDENGYMTKVEKNGNIASNITIEMEILCNGPDFQME